jgi:hypothetical protein
MKGFITFLIIALTISSMASASCQGPLDLLVVGDSQLGATWSKSYTGNFLQQCLKGNFAIYARGGTVPGNWIGSGGMDHIETIQRTPQEEHLNLGSGESVPLCKKRIGPMIDSHQPKRVLFEFGGNYIAAPDEVISSQIRDLVKILDEKKIASKDCYFLHQTYEMEVATKRNVPLKNLQNTKRILSVISLALKGKCQMIDGLELMKDSPYFDGKENLKRVLISGRGGCGGAAVNDNAHVCGSAAQDMAERLCLLFNQK